MPARAVPVSMGSPRFQVHEACDCVVTLAWFPPGATLDAHTHDRPTFATILDGGFDLVFTSPSIRRSRISCLPGTLFTEPAGEMHANYVGPDGARVVVLQPDPAAAELPEACVAMLDRVNEFRDGPIGLAARRIAREIAAPDDLTPLAIDGLVLEMLADAARLDRESGLGTRQLPTWFRRASDIVHDSFRDGLRIEHIARAAGVHPAHLAAMFRRVHRMPLGSYMRQLRVEWATTQLADSDRPIASIAIEAGFADQAHLTRWVRKAIGTTPSAYRRARRSHKHEKAPSDAA
jgi:AraC family transcriptional regulator